MSVSLQSIRVIGVHPFVADQRLVEEAREDFWGGGELTEEREAHVQGFFKDLYVIEIETSPANAEIDWSAITQPCSDLTGDYWQVPYLEAQTDESGSRYAFFFHYLDRSKPLNSPLGDIVLPEPTPLPPHLQKMEYGLP